MEVKSLIINMFTEQRKKLLTEKVWLIIQDNQLSREEIRALFGASKTSDNDSRPGLTNAADQIISLFIREQLTINEGKCVLQEITESSMKMDRSI